MLTDTFPASHQPLDRARARRAVAGYRGIDYSIVWADWSLSMCVAAAAGATALAASSLVWSAAGIGVAALALYRAALFSHEIVHLGSRCSRAFWWTWNLLCGVPSLLPSFVIESHMLHHSGRRFGTGTDPEYTSFGLGPRRTVVLYIASNPAAVVGLFLRHSVIAPLAWAAPSLRRFVDEYVSSGAIHLPFKNPTPRFSREDRIIEVVCFAYCAVLTGLTLSGIVPFSAVLRYWAILSLAMTLNSVRTVISHRFGLVGPVSWEEQALDSINLDRPSLVTTLLAPVGMRYHAVHHMFPRIPYHELKAAHERLMREFGVQSEYASLSYSSAFAALADLWRRAGRSAA